MATVSTKKNWAKPYDPAKHVLHIGDMGIKSYDPCSRKVLARERGRPDICHWVVIKKQGWLPDELMDVSWVEETHREAKIACASPKPTPIAFNWDTAKSLPQRERRRVLRRVSRQLKKKKRQKKLTILMPKGIKRIEPSS